MLPIYCMSRFQLIGTILLTRELRQTRNMFLINLAASDIVVIVTVIPFNVISEISTLSYLGTVHK